MGLPRFGANKCSSLFNLHFIDLELELARLPDANETDAAKVAAIRFKGGERKCSTASTPGPAVKVVIAGVSPLCPLRASVSTIRV